MSATQLRQIERAARTIAEATARRDALIREARESGETWQDIATAAGMTRQGAHKAATRDVSANPQTRTGA